MGTTAGWVWLKDPSETLLAGVTRVVGPANWSEDSSGWHVAHTRRYDEVAFWLATRAFTTVVGWVEGSDLAALQFTSRRVGPVFLPIADYGEDGQVQPLTGRIPPVLGLPAVRQWCSEANLPAFDQAELTTALDRKEVYAEDKLEAVIAVLGLPPATTW